MKVQSFLHRVRPIAIGTSMADLALLLLIFFMVSTSTEPPPGVTVELPKAFTHNAEQEGIYITISREGRLYLDTKETDLSDLPDILAIRQSEKNKVVSITADRRLPYRHVSRVIEILREQDFLNVVFMSESGGRIQ